MKCRNCSWFVWLFDIALAEPRRANRRFRSRFGNRNIWNNNNRFIGTGGGGGEGGGSGCGGGGGGGGVKK